MDKITAGLERDGILTGAGGKKWHTSTINKILRNEKYIGDALLQKTYTTDFLNKTRVKNNGLVPQYYVEGDHEAIIPKNIYQQIQEELVRHDHDGADLEPLADRHFDRLIGIGGSGGGGGLGRGLCQHQRRRGDQRFQAA